MHRLVLSLLRAITTPLFTLQLAFSLSFFELASFNSRHVAMTLNAYCHNADPAIAECLDVSQPRSVNKAAGHVQGEGRLVLEHLVITPKTASKII